MSDAFDLVRVVDEPHKGLVVARETGRRFSTADILAFVDADCRAPITWLERVEAQFDHIAGPVAVTGPDTVICRPAPVLVSRPARGRADSSP